MAGFLDTPNVRGDRVAIAVDLCRELVTAANEIGVRPHETLVAFGAAAASLLAAWQRETRDANIEAFLARFREEVAHDCEQIDILRDAASRGVDVIVQSSIGGH